MSEVKNNDDQQIEKFITEHTPAMLAYLDANLRYKYVNKAYAELFGKSTEDIVDSKTPKDLLCANAYDQSNIQIQAALQGEPQIFHRETQMPGGEKRYYFVNYQPDVEQGRVNGFLATIVDVTDARVPVSEIYSSHELLKKQNAQLTNFTHIVSHNLKSYARNLNMAIDLFVNATGENQKNNALELLQEIASGISSIILNVSEISRVQTNAELPVQRIVLFDYLERTIDLLSLQIEESKACVLNKIPADVAIDANPAYIDSIMQNILSNAIKYRHPERTPVIEITCNVAENEVTLLFKDNGLGIDLTKYGNKIFGIFQRFHKNPEAGGLGLFISKYQVEAMGGHIEIESESGIGSIFKVHLKKH